MGSEGGAAVAVEVDMAAAADVAALRLVAVAADASTFDVASILERKRATLVAVLLLLLLLTSGCRNSS